MSAEHKLWYYARHEDSESWSGGLATYDEAVAAARGDFGDEAGFYVCVAYNPPLRLAEWIGADRLLECAEDQVFDSDRLSSEHDDGPFFDCTPEQAADLQERIKRACDEWQAAHGLIFTCRSFADMSVPELVEAQT